jgi:hypothetical protein
MKRSGHALSRSRVNFRGQSAGLIVDHISDYYPCPFVDEQPGLGGTLSARTTGNQRNLSFKPIHVTSHTSVIAQADGITLQKPSRVLAYLIISTPPVTSAKIVAPFLVETVCVQPLGR